MGLDLMPTFTLPVKMSIPIIILLIVLIIVELLVAYTALSIVAPIRVEVTEDYVRVSTVSLLASSYTVRRTNVSEVCVLSGYDEYKPVMRIWGLGAPGKMVGWFKLANGCRCYVASASSGLVLVFLGRGGHPLLVLGGAGWDLVEALRGAGWRVTVGSCPTTRC